MTHHGFEQFLRKENDERLNERDNEGEERRGDEREFDGRGAPAVPRESCAATRRASFSL
ncbi:hypothetical protein ACVWW6_006551 [Bradyrhizobium sp. USDA 3311]